MKKLALLLVVILGASAMAFAAPVTTTTLAKTKVVKTKRVHKVAKVKIEKPALAPVTPAKAK